MCNDYFPYEEYRKKIGIFIVAFNAQDTIKSVLTRIQPGTWNKISEVFIFDDGSKDNTEKMAADYQGFGAEKIRFFYNQINLGYGGNQKRGYLES